MAIMNKVGWKVDVRRRDNLGVISKLRKVSKQKLE